MSELANRNRAILAELQHWPAGALEACERVERDHPAWAVCWMPENPPPARGHERPALFLAQRRRAHTVHLRDARGITEAELRADIERLDDAMAAAIKRARRTWIPLVPARP